MALIDTATAARRLKISNKRVLQLIKAGKLPATKVTPGVTKQGPPGLTDPWYIEEFDLEKVRKVRGVRGTDGRKRKLK